MTFDIDLDFGNRDEILSYISHTPASLENGRKHNSGVYCTIVPTNPLTGQCSLSYHDADEAGFFKLDFLNQSVYSKVKSPEHMEKLMNMPIDWKRLNTDREFVEQLPHIGTYFDKIVSLPEPITNIEELSFFLAALRPAKKYLMGLSWDKVRQHIWKKEENGQYQYKKSHSISYSTLCTLAMRIICDMENTK
jgi:hypothetical protein